MKSSTYTKKCRRSLWICRIIDFILLFAPLFVYIVIALTSEESLTYQKVAVVGSIAIAGILTIFNVLAQKRLRCPIWIVLLGLYVCIKNYLLPLMIILAITTILDDLVLTPLIDHYRTKLIANKAIDERIA